MIRIHTGPVSVRPVGARVRPLITALGAEVIVGTEHLIFTGLTPEQLRMTLSVAGLRSWVSCVGGAK